MSSRQGRLCVQMCATVCLNAAFPSLREPPCKPQPHFFQVATPVTQATVQAGQALHQTHVSLPHGDTQEKGQSGPSSPDGTRPHGQWGVQSGPSPSPTLPGITCSPCRPEDMGGGGQKGPAVTP